MFHIDYIAPRSLEEFLSVLHQHGREAKIIAGGTDLIPQMRIGKLAPRVLVDPKQLPLVGIAEEDGYICLGAQLTHSQALNSPFLKQEYPALVEACRQVGGPAVRNRGTLAGNLANASPAADSALPLLVYDAQIIATRFDGEREIPLVDFYLGPGETHLAENEFIREIRVPRAPLRTKSAFLKIGNRNSMAIAVASIAVQVSLNEIGQVDQVRIALGSVAPTPVRAYQAEAILQSNHLTETSIRLAAEAAQQAACPITDLRASAGYRNKLVAVLTRRALEMVESEFSAGNDNG